MTHHDTRNGIALILLGAVLFGLLPSAARLAYDDGANVLFIILARAVIGIAIFMSFLAVTGRSAGFGPGILRQSWKAGLASSAGALGMFASIRYIDISLASMVLFLYPFPVAVISHLRGETPLTLPVLALMVLATFGTVLVVGVSFDNLDWRGLAFAFLGMAAFAVLIIAMSDLTRQIGAVGSNLIMTFWSLGVYSLVALIATPLGLISGVAMPVTPVGWAHTLVVGMTFALGYLCFFIGANMIGSARASLLSISEPVLMILFALVLVGEVLSPLQWVGVVLVVGSLSLSEAFRR